MATARKNTNSSDEQSSAKVDDALAAKESIPVLVANKRGDVRLYGADGLVMASWDRSEPVRHVWKQVGRHIGGMDAEVGFMRIDVIRLPDVCPQGELEERGTVESRIPQPAPPKKGTPMTTYHTNGTPVESLG